MAKKKSSEQPQPAAAPAKRPRAKKAAPAAPPVDIGTVSGTEPLSIASDTSSSPRAGTATGATENNGSQPSHDEIAEAAYFRHLNRGGGGGDEFTDWVEAERELRERRR